MAKLAMKKGMKEECNFFQGQAEPITEKKEPTIEDVLTFGNRHQRREALRMIRKMNNIKI